MAMDELLCPPSDGPFRLSELLMVSISCSFGMQVLVNLPLSLSSTADNFTGFAEFFLAAFYSWISHRHGLPLFSHASVATCCLLMWSLRLTAFLLHRMTQRPPVDTRLGKAKQRSVLGTTVFWLIHGSWGVVVSLPVTLLNGCASTSPYTVLGPIGWFGTGVWLCGFVMPWRP